MKYSVNVGDPKEMWTSAQDIYDLGTQIITDLLDYRIDSHRAEVAALDRTIGGQRYEINKLQTVNAELCRRIELLENQRA